MPKPSREEIEWGLKALDEKLREKEAALPVHSIRPGQIEELEEQTGTFLTNLSSYPILRKHRSKG